MDLQAEIAKIKTLLPKAQNILIVTHERPTFDSVGSSLALMLGLAGLGKKVTVACPDEMIVALSSFVGVNKIVREVGKKNLIVSLDYVEGSIDKVSYNIAGDKFNLVIEPRVGFPPFAPEKVRYTYGPTAVDLIIAVDTISLGGLKQLYEVNKELFSSKQIINLDRHPNNARYGTLNILDFEASATAEVIAYVLADIGAKLTADIATNLLNALYSATDSFQNPNLTPTAFELAGSCIRAGGLRFSEMPPPQQIPQVEAKVGDQTPQSTPVAPTPPTTSIAPTPTTTPPEPPDDWLKPKIFKSSGSLL